MQIKSEGLVFRTTKYGDDGLIVDVLTCASGIVSFMVKRSRSPRAAVRHTLFQPLTCVELTWDCRKVGVLQKPTSARCVQGFIDLHAHPYKASMALFLSEFLHYAVRVETPPGLLYDYLVGSLTWLDAAPDQFSNFHLVFLLRLARFLGFSPNLDTFAPGRCFDLRAGVFVDGRPDHPDFVPPSDAARLPLLMRMNYGTMRLFRFTGEERNRTLTYINAYYRQHLPSFPELKSLDVLRQVFR